MVRLELEQTRFSPYVLMDSDEQKYIIRGRSIPNNAKMFFEPIVDWLVEFKGKVSHDFTIELHLEYFNTSTHKYLDDILRIIGSFHVSTKVIWKYVEDDDDLLEIGERLQDYCKIPFDYVIVEED